MALVACQAQASVVSSSTAHSRKSGMETRHKPLSSSPELVRRVHGLRAIGLSQRGIAQEAGVSKSSVHRLLALPLNSHVTS